MSHTPDWPTVGPELLDLVTRMERILRGPAYLVREQVAIQSLGTGQSWPERARAAIAAAKGDGA